MIPGRPETRPLPRQPRAAGQGRQARSGPETRGPGTRRSPPRNGHGGRAHLSRAHRIATIRGPHIRGPGEAGRSPATHYSGYFSQRKAGAPQIFWICKKGASVVTGAQTGLPQAGPLPAARVLRRDRKPHEEQGFQGSRAHGALWEVYAIVASSSGIRGGWEGTEFRGLLGPGVSLRHSGDLAPSQGEVGAGAEWSQGFQGDQGLPVTALVARTEPYRVGRLGIRTASAGSRLVAGAPRPGGNLESLGPWPGSRRLGLLGEPEE
jgi:hypothetical protein